MGQMGSAGAALDTRLRRSKTCLARRVLALAKWVQMEEDARLGMLADARQG